ncbi:beta-N-acetylhexosaminidase [Frigidibacter sp. RF13]|uniref:beta-N-acetylhexosaminidase n=1 Tax=Frigidibacter sp. RF13 TaxID=2997340 RepID=UPI0022705FD2|nr:beta-N-acetylhexosaminidase [Frigidibacter sp. RF13]MCY1126100.1 beta-N-acetylhexosaminidase [Frigidibacter sp. RF13]
MRRPFLLETHWTPAKGGGPPEYRLRLTNRGRDPITDFTLVITGPGRLTAKDRVEGARLIRRLSNNTELAPEEGSALASGASWTMVAHHLSYPLRHWSDGATTAYLKRAGGGTEPVEVRATHKVGDNRPLKRGAAPYPVPASAPEALSVIPWPEHVEIAATRAAPVGFAITAEAAEAGAAATAFARLCQALFPTEALSRSTAEGGFPVDSATDGTLAPEAYRIRFASDRITVTASGHAGFLYGFITLAQALRGARDYPQTFTFPESGSIADAPAMGWRGCHLDCARQFYTSAEVERFLGILAWNRLNRFHWHLTDDEAWRIEIAALPELTEIGAWRGEELPIPALLGTGAERSGGYYTQETVRRIVGVAESYGITTLPEIDIPGHSFALLAARPDLRDPGESGTYASVQGFPNNCLNPAVPRTYEILGMIFDELAELFPARIVHVGADEVPLAAWSGSPLAFQRIAELGGAKLAEAHARLKDSEGNHGGADAIEGSATALLQADFLSRVQQLLAERGCVTGGWEEAAHGDVIDKSASYLVGWRDTVVSGALAAKGYSIVVSPGQSYYLDMSQSSDWVEPGAGWAGWSSPRETYAFDPTAGWTDAQRTKFMGVQACIWSESMTDRALFDRLTFPRLSAIAETGWTRAERKDWERFVATVGLMPLLYGHREA